MSTPDEDPSPQAVPPVGARFTSMGGFRPVTPPASSDRIVRTTADYLACLEEGDRWIEMDDGTFLRHDPPDEIHGNIVRNLTQTIGPCLKQEAKYIPCFELPLLLNAEKPTIRVPAISFFPASKGFGMMDELVTAQAPTLAVEIASSRWRREAMSSRVKDYLLWGVQAVWVVDPVSRHVHQFGTGTPPKMIKETETMHGYPYFADLHVLVIDLFADPNWLHPAKPPVREG